VFAEMPESMVASPVFLCYRKRCFTEWRCAPEGSLRAGRDFLRIAELFSVT